MSEPNATPSESCNPVLWQPPAWVPPVLFALVGTAMMTWNPDGWIHPLIDYGRELYVPWRLTAGEVLYRDLAYFNGPLSPYLNALWFRIFGVNMHVLTVANLAIAAGVLALLYRLVIRISDRLTATCGGMVFLLLFVFQHADNQGNFSWVAPYSHEMTHGVGLAILCAWLSAKYVARPRTAWLVGIGLALGAGFLTKPEAFLAAGFTVLVTLTANGFARLEKQPAAPPLHRQLGIVGATALVLPAMACGLLALAMPVGAALTGVMGGWVYVLNRQLTALPFYSKGRGTHDILGSVLDNLEWTGVLLVWLSCGLALAWLLKPRRATNGNQPRDSMAKIRPMIALALASGLPIYDLWFAPARDLAIQPVLLMVIGLTFVYLRRLIKRRDATAIHGLALCALGLGLLPKIILNVRFHLYGFGLAGPATLVSIVGLTYWLPRVLARYGWAAGVYRGFVIGFLAMFLSAALKFNRHWFAQKTAVAGGLHEQFHSADGMWERPAHVTTKWILANTQPDDTLVVLPEGISINYFTRRINPTGQLNFMPPEVIMFGEDRILHALQANPPDYCAVIHRLTGEYGVDYNLFGTHYGQRIMHWVGTHYTPVFKYGAEPLHVRRLQDRQTGLLIMKRRE